jgi:hypothetical protein
MRKFLTSFAVLLIVQQHVSHAQAVIKAGTVQLGGSIGYSQQSTDGPYALYTGSGYLTTTQYVKTKFFGVSPSVSYFVADNLAIGLNGVYNRTTNAYSYSSNYGAGSEQKSSQYTIGGFAQYYKMFTEQFGIVGTLGAGYFRGNTELMSFFSNASSSKGFTTSLTPSIVFFPIPQFALGASIGNLGYIRSKNTVPAANIGSNPSTMAEDTYTSSSFGANFGLNQLTFSGAYFFGR